MEKKKKKLDKKTLKNEIATRAMIRFVVYPKKNMG